jgi:hypothetical protein
VRIFSYEFNEDKLTDVTLAIVAANNHYVGFGPGTVNIFRQLLGLEELKWGDGSVVTDDLEKEDEASKNKRVVMTKQTSLSDFLNPDTLVLY